MSEKQAYYMKNQIEERLRQYKLELNQEKTRVVYTGAKKDHDKRGHGISMSLLVLPPKKSVQLSLAHSGCMNLGVYYKGGQMSFEQAYNPDQVRVVQGIGLF